MTAFLDELRLLISRKLWLSFLFIRDCWRDEQIQVIDVDLGKSGASSADREGFQRLVAQVSLGKAGIVLGLEVSRLARNNSDWHRLLEICAIPDGFFLYDNVLNSRRWRITIS